MNDGWFTGLLLSRIAAFVAVPLPSTYLSLVDTLATFRTEDPPTLVKDVRNIVFVDASALAGSSIVEMVAPLKALLMNYRRQVGEPQDNSEYVICPYCQYHHGDAWEWAGGYTSPTEISCDDCDRKFTVSVDYDVTYHTDPIHADDPHTR